MAVAVALVPAALVPTVLVAAVLVVAVALAVAAGGAALGVAADWVIEATGFVSASPVEALADCAEKPSAAAASAPAASGVSRLRRISWRRSIFASVRVHDVIAAMRCSMSALSVPRARASCSRSAVRNRGDEPAFAPRIAITSRTKAFT